MIYDSVLDLVGNTPMVRVHSLTNNSAVELYIKLEKMNPSRSTLTNLETDPN